MFDVLYLLWLASSQLLHLIKQALVFLLKSIAVILHFEMHLDLVVCVLASLE